MTKIEEVARAIRTISVSKDGLAYLADEDVLKNIARAALEAMKRPTIKMEHEFLTAWFGVIQPAEELYRDQLHRAFNTMIQAALDEK